MPKRKIVLSALIAGFLMIPVGIAVQSALDYTVYLPYVSAPGSEPVPTPTPTPIPGNRVCVSNPDKQICAWVSNIHPSPNTTVTVYGHREVFHGATAWESMKTVWHFPSGDWFCSDGKDFGMVTECSQNIGMLPIGYRVDIDVTIDEFTVTTWFILQ